MKCSKPRFAFRPLVEKLESRLQPGSLITGNGYGWSLVADRLSILDQGSLDSQSFVSPSSFQSSKPSAINTSVDVHSDNLEIAVASVAAARSSNLPTNNLVDNLAAGLTNDDLSNLSLMSHSHPVPFAAVATPPIQQPAPATPMGSVPQSPIGVANPAQPAGAAAVANPSTPVNSAFSIHRGGPVQEINLGTPTMHPITGLQSTNLLHVAPFTLATTLPEPGGDAGNQATVNFLSYLGGTGPASINNVVVRNEGGTNFMYVAGSVTDSTGRTDAFAAKLAGDGTAVMWMTPLMTPTPGPDNATGLAVNGNNVYLAGSLADPASTPQMDGFVVELDANSGALGPQSGLNGASFAAVTADSTGNVYVVGLDGHRDNQGQVVPGQVDIAFLQLTADLSTTNYASAFAFTLSGNPANSKVTTGGGVVVDGQGHAYFAGTIGAVGDPNNETLPLYGRLNATGDSLDWFVGFLNVTPGPGGLGTGAALDSNGNVLFTGSINDNGSGSTPGNPTMLNQDLLLARVAQAPNADGTANVVDATQWYVDDRSGGNNAPRVGDWTGNSLVVLADGSSIVTGATYDPAAGTNMGNPTSVPTKGIDVHVTHFGADDQSTTQNPDGDPENTFGGSGMDVGNAVALDPTTTNSPYNVYVVGSTNSTDLPTTAGVIQPNYTGTSTTGFVGQARVA